MQATINYGKVQVRVVGALDAPITKPHCSVCGGSAYLHSIGDGWLCERCRRKFNGFKFDRNTCPACGAFRRKPTKVYGVYECAKCGAIYGECYLGESYEFVLPYFDETTPDPKDVRYYDFVCLGSDGITRRHGWYNPQTKRIVQVG